MVKIINLIKYLVVIGDVTYILWILYNGINEGFRNIRSVESIVLMGLILLLSFNIIILFKQKQ